ncbi:MAG: 16S rRNA (cytosine(1402)-N(4))-methyltransferase RsmH [Gammaproteobacteria bacterium]|nr:16S rRNA (cytosine(1402)-N(4))-methyltransferase RsmH [Gammaproteobacteria bacterium]
MQHSASVSATHVPVLLDEVVAILCPLLEQRRSGRFVDATFGRGGHARALLARLSPDARLLVMDRDPAAVDQARALADTDSRVLVRHAAFGDLGEIVPAVFDGQSVDGLLLDIGVSSPQLDDAGRGFSFMRDGPLDMRMDTSRGISAAQWLAAADDAEIAGVLRDYGEERHARRIATAIVREREHAPVDRTLRLASIISECLPRQRASRSGRDAGAARAPHPATRSFQAIRIFVNQELRELERALHGGLDLLADGGRMLVISFHSLEDRIVKRFFRSHFNPPRPSRHRPVAEDAEAPLLSRVEGPLRPSQAELARNPRARSACLRWAEKRAVGQS